MEEEGLTLAEGEKRGEWEITEWYNEVFFF